MRIGILGTSDVAFRRFLPSLMKCEGAEYAGVASRTPEKAVPFQENFGGTIYESYDALIEDPLIDAVYVPLPPALHYQWGRKVLLAGKHLLMEKPFAAGTEEANELLNLAQQQGKIVHENYMFLYHDQLREIHKMIQDGTLGEIRLYRMSFGFPKRSRNDFRYDKTLGGGAILDCGGYPVRLALDLLGETAELVQSSIGYIEDFDVEMYGSAVLVNQDGTTAQISYGMDNAYQCELEIWGSKATLRTDRIFTAGSDYVPKLNLKTSSEEYTVTLREDDQFLHSIEQFLQKINSGENTDLETIRKQAELVDAMRKGNRL